MNLGMKVWARISISNSKPSFSGRTNSTIITSTGWRR
jgi:hypothetical protein